MSLQSIWKESLSGFLDIIYPRNCVVCRSSLSELEEHICFSCRLLLPIIQPHSHELEVLKSRFWGKVRLLNVIAHLRYEKKGPVQGILKSIKYHRNQELAILMGELMASAFLSGHAFEADMIIPVPLHPKKEGQRGFNQSERIAQGFSEVSGIPVRMDIACRTVNTRTQTKLNREERWENVKSIFEIRQPDMIPGKKIAILDDVVTTGSTFESLALAIEAYKPRSIQVMALAMAD